MTGRREIDAALRYISDLMWDAEEDHYGDNSGNMDRDVHGRVYALWDLSRALDRQLGSAPEPSREQILDVVRALLHPLEEQLAQRPEALGRDLGGRVVALREVRAAIAAGDHRNGEAD